MTEKYRLTKHGTYLYDNELKKKIYDWVNDDDKIIDLLNEQHKTITYLKEVIDSRDVEISELGKQRNHLVDENKALQLKIKMLEQVKPIKELPKSIDVVIRNE